MTTKYKNIHVSTDVLIKRLRQLAIATRHGTSAIDRAFRIGSGNPEVDADLLLLESARRIKQLETKLQTLADAMCDRARDGLDFDGDEMEALLVSLGLIKRVTVTEPCDDNQCACADVGDFPQQCYRKTYT